MLISFFIRYHLLVSKFKCDVPHMVQPRLMQWSSDKDTEIRRIWHMYSYLQKSILKLNILLFLLCEKPTKYRHYQENHIMIFETAE